MVFAQQLDDLLSELQADGSSEQQPVFLDHTADLVFDIATDADETAASDKDGADLLALLAFATLGSATGIALTWVFNTFGAADLLFAFYLGSRVSLPNTPGLLGAGYFILAAYVPLLLITHGLVFRILLGTKAVVPSPSKARIA